MHAFVSRNRYFGYTGLIIVCLVTALLALNHRYFFLTELHEHGDLAANSLDVLRAKKFECLYGAYSRWGFHHPGPAFFYALAFGETIFWQDLHWVPAPFNAQTVVDLVLAAFFLAVGIGTAARWVRSAFFLPLALLVATLHLSSVHLDSCMMSSWTAFVMPIPFFCLIVVAASVAAGRGEALPMLALTGCLLIHIHIVQVLFVLSLFSIAYVGLSWNCIRGRRADGRTTMSSWRLYARAHVAATVIVVIFLVPIFIDLCKGANSNIALIWNHLRTHRGERHPYVDALSYFLRFATYKPPTAVAGESFGNISGYVINHPEMFGLWLSALLAPFLALSLRRWRRSDPAARGDGLTIGTSGAADRWKYLCWLGVCIVLTTLLTIFWAHIQDGPMYYYNAAFNYGLYLALALWAVIGMSDGLESLTARFHRPWMWNLPVSLVCIALVYFNYQKHPERYRASQGDSPELRQTTETVLTALAEHPTDPRIVYLGIPDGNALEAAPAVAIFLRRLGYQFRVAPKWKTMLGSDNALADFYPESLVDAQKQSPMRIWHFTPAASAPDAAIKHPLLAGWGLESECVAIDPAPQAAIVLAGPAYNASRFELQGFGAPTPGLDYTLTTAEVAMVNFTPKPIPADGAVEITVDYINSFGDPKKHPVQRMQLKFDDSDQGTFTARMNAPMPVIQVQIPAALWNAARPVAFLSLVFPDAIHPGELDPANQDPRQIAFTIKKVTFRLSLPGGVPRS